MCGEHSIPSKSTATQPGSSPRVRGTRFQTKSAPLPAGIIPACAGNTFGFVRAAPPPWDHPRVCGEHKETSNGFAVIAGSSPRVRGTQLRVVEDAPCLGIIPACAGNTSYDKNAGDATGDHPRVCGEHVQGPVLFGHLPGSSPRVRGTQEAAGLSAVLRGIIPACAGNTEFRRMLMISARDHPRVCGEHSSPFQSRFSPAGSSPRVRGTLEYLPDGGWKTGIIPACAGNTCPCSPIRVSSGDHPRVCGEHIRMHRTIQTA